MFVQYSCNWRNKGSLIKVQRPKLDVNSYLCICSVLLLLIARFQIMDQLFKEPILEFECEWLLRLLVSQKRKNNNNNKISTMKYVNCGWKNGRMEPKKDMHLVYRLQFGGKKIWFLLSGFISLIVLVVTRSDHNLTCSCSLFQSFTSLKFKGFYHPF